MTLKRAISACLPSYFVDKVRERRFAQELAEQERKDGEAIERERASREASSWEDAVTRSGKYDAHELTEFRIARNALAEPTGDVLRSNILAVVARLVSKPGLTVTDFGGSTGELGKDFLREFCATAYTVVEVAGLVESIRNTGGVIFTKDMPPSCDIFYSSGTIQYLERPMELLQLAFQSARYAVVLRRNHFSNEKKYDIQYSRLFENGVGPVPDGFTDKPISYPRQTVSELDVHRLAGDQGFRCILSLEESVLPGGYGRQLVFWRNAN